MWLHNVKVVLAGLATAILVVACTTSPTGRTQLNLMGGADLRSMGAQSFEQIKAEEQVLDDPAINAYVQCVADALIEVVPERYAEENWEVVVFDSEMVNAFALPGGYIGFYTGMLRLAETPDQLAAVMGHEIGHVMANHASERMSGNLLISGALLGADIALSDRPASQRATIMAGLGIGAQLGVMLPYSRTHESEADEIGMDLMAQAGFDPAGAIQLWENMRQAGSGGTPEMLSTHPSPDTRIRDLERQQPDVMPLYEERLRQGAAPECPRPASLSAPE